MLSDIIHAVFISLLVSLILVACGPNKAAPKAGRTDCETRCDLELMRCLETRVCLELGGQRTPCLDECKAELARCEQACGGS